MDMEKIVKDLKLNKVYLSSKMNMPFGTFNNKISSSQPAYRFSEVENKKLLSILLEISQKISVFVNEEFKK